MSKLIYVLLAFAIVAQVAMHYPDLPERIASHYDAAGVPNDFTTKSGFVTMYAIISVMVFGMFAAVPWLVRKLPVSLINLPNREYWLAPERKDASIARVGVMMDVFAGATGALLLCIFEMTFRANESGNGHLPPPWPLLGGYLAFVAIWLVMCFRAFPKPT